ncbi:MAG: DNA-binding response regulator [Bacteroidetes bacterium GWB2_41_8]|nr:MAG: DNA-binding response regulator [Bacteroidetes bacterium GWB2_41_8]
MKCIVIDDEELARVVIEKLITNNPELNLVAEFPNAIQAIKFLNHNPIDLIFLDIHMPDFTGLDFIQTLKSPPKIILTTSDRNFAIEAFEYECIVDYLTKPLSQERFDKAVKKALLFNFNIKAANSKIQVNSTNPSTELFVNIDRRLVKIEFDGILFIESKGDYIQINTEKKNITVHSTIKKIKVKLPPELFVQVHRSYIINIKKIVDIEDSSVLIGKTVIPISRANRDELMNCLNLL